MSEQEFEKTLDAKEQQKRDSIVAELYNDISSSDDDDEDEVVPKAATEETKSAAQDSKVVKEAPAPAKAPVKAAAAKPDQQLANPFARQSTK